METLAALIPSDTRVVPLRQRQDSLMDQMFDIMALANVYGYRDASLYIQAVMFDNTVLHYEHDNAIEQLPAVIELARASGAQDAVDWLKQTRDYL